MAHDIAASSGAKSIAAAPAGSPSATTRSRFARNRRRMSISLSRSCSRLHSAGIPAERGGNQPRSPRGVADDRGSMRLQGAGTYRTIRSRALTPGYKLNGGQSRATQTQNYLTDPCAIAGPALLAGAVAIARPSARWKRQVNCHKSS